MSYSLAAGLGDRFYDIDCGIRYAEPSVGEDLEARGAHPVSSVGTVTEAPIWADLPRPRTPQRVTRLSV